ncbi:MAG: Xaa-Pro peptidase family protein [Anaeromicrobium sp.]|jgi:Xaa-Pro dipeptidase|uniref:M24 family metallopeptidase n=1 Tax=Anaeromicrobium sp. TaxID=1929132 RepID=UPI0025EFD674|nr:Xaa-Pro peptidase family protein [Anaeromicrobium sp.]MCT4593835.1 Xaa-Pro peptidase family protein [Anaeromicrobium sp.]
MKKERLNRILENMDKHHIEQLIITCPNSIFYLLEKWIHPGERMLALFINKEKKAKLIINELFPIEGDLGVDLVVYNDTENPINYLGKFINKEILMGIDKEWPSRFLIELLNQMEGLKVTNSSIVIDEVRMIKDKEELDLMRKASRINDKAMGELLEYVKEGKYTEAQLGKILGTIYAKYGGDGFSFSPLICYGENAAEPHHSSDDTILKENSSIIIDIGCFRQNYASDMTRSFFYGEPSEEYKEIYELVRKANKTAIGAVRPGVKFSEIDKAARKVIEDGGYGKYFTHRTGHNIGINVHEFPDVSSANHMPVQEGMVFSIEPGIYIPGKYGVRIEDLVVVTKDGCEVLNQYPKELVTLK